MVVKATHSLQANVRAVWTAEFVEHFGHFISVSINIRAVSTWYNVRHFNIVLELNLQILSPDISSDVVINTLTCSMSFINNCLVVCAYSVQNIDSLCVDYVLRHLKEVHPSRVKLILAVARSLELIQLHCYKQHEQRECKNAPKTSRYCRKRRFLIKCKSDWLRIKVPTMQKVIGLLLKSWAATLLSR